MTATEEPTGDSASTGGATLSGVMERDVRSTVSPLRAGFAGLLAGAAALSAGELVASFFAPKPGPVIAVANRVIEYAPSWFIEFGKAVFGLADKPALVLGTVIISLILATGFGIASRRNRRIGVFGITGFGVLGMLAIGTDAQGDWGTAIFVSLLSVLAGVATLIWLLNRARVGVTNGAASTANTTTGDEAVVTDSPVDPALSRRSFLNVAGAVGASAAIGAAGANLIRSRSSASEARAAVQLDSQLAGTGLDAQLTAAESSAVATTPGITPLIIPNDNFYLIDTAILKPQVDPANWQLTIKGMVDREISYTYDQLLDRANMVEPVTLSCVSNQVGGDLVGNAVWQGVALTELLDEAGVADGATQIASRSVDGWTCGFPTELAYDGRTSMVAIAMNDEPLPVAHGFPARLVVSGLYGYVSATKWVSEIELTTLEGFDGYWIPKGWSKLGPVKTQSRIDTPRSGTPITAGEVVPIAGVAWAPNIGIERVEVQIDSEDWQDAELGDSLGSNAWRQWVLPWTAVEGRHVIRVRATDASGYTQTPDLAPPAPSGATGWHQVTVSA
ncbi:MAG: molybdopterin-dependent oxidoreductase [Acidimicrobiales bacterium]